MWPLASSGMRTCSGPSAWTRAGTCQLSNRCLFLPVPLSAAVLSLLVHDLLLLPCFCFCCCCCLCSPCLVGGCWIRRGTGDAKDLLMYLTPPLSPTIFPFSYFSCCSWGSPLPPRVVPSVPHSPPYRQNSSTVAFCAAFLSSKLTQRTLLAAVIATSA